MSEPQQRPPGTIGAMARKPDHGENSYRGSGRLTGKAAVITGADSGIGRAVAIAFAREGADALISYLDEHEDARDTAKYVEAAGRRAVLVPGDLADRAVCDRVAGTAADEFGHIDVLVNNAAFQMTHETFEEITDEEWTRSGREPSTSTSTRCSGW
ncbi:SDR family NAD(P)-dependent oxidoreductase [Dactylosporangium sp. NPDC000555]|uniref:SDR family NAD(P)-dependent oxidoreductase n=1 Tax=Dactylosporangium sp. NPDC000555 TaxID=3154260 RepID=UPI00331C42C5